MVTYSDGDINLAIQSLLIQFYPILLSTLLSVKRKQLSLFDVEFALTVSSSPLAIYLSFASVCDLCGIRTGLFKRIKSHLRIIRTLGILAPLFWTVLSMIKSLSRTAFLDSPCSPISTFRDWLEDAVIFLVVALLFPGAPGNIYSTPGLTLFIPFFILLFRRRSQVWVDVQLSLGGASRLRVPFTWVTCAWYVPAPIGPRLAKPDARKLHYLPPTQMMYSSPVHVD